MRLIEKLFGRILFDEMAGDIGGAAGGGGEEADTGAADTADDDAGVTPPPADWPTDWRSKISADEKHTKTLSRFASPKAIYDSYMALRQKLDSGEVKAQTPFPTKGTDEEKAAWRTANGIPEAPEAYANAFKNYKPTEADKALMDDFLKHAHSLNMKPEHAEGVLGWYSSVQSRMAENQQAHDGDQLQKAEDALRSEWGGEYRRNLNMIRGLLDSMPQDVQPLFVGARLADGRALMNTPEIARWLLETALTVNPVGTFVPGAGANIASAIEDEISDIEKVMKTDRKRYNNDSKMQSRLLELYGARERVKK